MEFDLEAIEASLPTVELHHIREADGTMRTEISVDYRDGQSSRPVGTLEFESELEANMVLNSLHY